MSEYLRAATLVLGGFALGLTLIVVILYLRLHRAGGTDKVYQVPVIGFSHLLLIAAIEGEIVQHYIQQEPFEWWLSPLAAVAYGLSIWALVQMLRSEELRSAARDVEAHGLF